MEPQRISRTTPRKLWWEIRKIQVGQAPEAIAQACLQDPATILQAPCNTSPRTPQVGQECLEDLAYIPPPPKDFADIPPNPQGTFQKNPGNAHHGLKDYTRHLPQDAPKSWLWCLSTLQHFHQDSPRQPRVANIPSRLCKISRGLQGMSRKVPGRTFPGNSRGNSKRRRAGTFQNL